MSSDFTLVGLNRHISFSKSKIAYKAKQVAIA